MKPCRNGTCHKPGRSYRYALGRRETVVCDSCLVALQAIGLFFTPIGEDDRPMWVRRSLSRDESNVGVAA